MCLLLTYLMRTCTFLAVFSKSQRLQNKTQGSLNYLSDNELSVQVPWPETLVCYCQGHSWPHFSSNPFARLVGFILFFFGLRAAKQRNEWMLIWAHRLQEQHEMLCKITNLWSWSISTGFLTGGGKVSPVELHILTTIEKLGPWKPERKMTGLLLSRWLPKDSA